MPGRIVLVLVAAIALVGGAGVAPAGAHVELDASDPEAGATLTTPPASLSLTFSTTPVTVGVDVVGPDGEPVAVGELVRQSATVVVPLPALEQAGTYTVSWRAANDAHPFTGEYTITLDLPTTTTTEPPTTSTSVAGTESVPAAASDGQAGGGGGTGTAVVVVSALAIAAAVVVLGLAWARRRAQQRRLATDAPGVAG